MLSGLQYVQLLVITCSAMWMCAIRLESDLEVFLRMCQLACVKGSWSKAVEQRHNAIWSDKSCFCLYVNWASQCLWPFPHIEMCPECLIVAAKLPVKYMAWGCTSATGVQCMWWKKAWTSRGKVDHSSWSNNCSLFGRIVSERVSSFMIAVHRAIKQKS